MWPASATSSPNPSFFLFLPSNTPSLSHRPLFNPPPSPFLFPRRLHLSSASLSPSSPVDDFNGWALLDTPARPTTTHKAFPSYAIVGVGTSLALLLALFAGFSLSRKGFKIQFPSPLQGMWSPIGTRDDPHKAAEFDASNEATSEAVPVAVTETVISEATEKPGLVTIPVSVDSTQEEALVFLKTLKIIEDDVKANELCTRREFARWLVKLNSSLERNPKHRIAPIVSLSGSVVTAFDDISVEDLDFRSIQGQSKRFQPNKPSTKAQAAVALTSGRMKEAISAELSRIEAENSARQVEAEEIRSELLSRGDIQKFWDEKLSEEKNHGFDVERLYLEAVNNLEEEKINQDKINAEFVKEKAAMDCQKQLLLSLKKEVDEISEKLASEKVIYVDEKHTVQKLLRDLEFKHEEMLDTKSTLEAEKEALHMLRSWVEDEARRSQARAAVLEEVGRRWKWDDRA